jgi:hypothetical protein
MLAVARRFDFERDAFAFPNELVWEYHFDAATGQTRSGRRQPPPRFPIFEACYREKATPIWGAYCRAEPAGPQCRR